MRILAIADIGDLSWKHGSGRADVLLSCGDVDDRIILEAARAFDCSRIFAVKGNHDGPSPFPEPIGDLHLRVRKEQGFSFGGINGAWRYKPRGHFLYDQAEVEKMLAAFPPVQVFLSHNSPRGVHDQKDGVHCGFDGLNSYIRRAKPMVVIHGHQHSEKESVIGSTRVVGAFEYRLIEI